MRTKLDAKSAVFRPFLARYLSVCIDAALAGLAEIQSRENIVRQRRVNLRKD